MPLYMLHQSMLLAKLLALDLPLEHEGHIQFIRLSIMKVCLWLCIYLCLLVLILVSCRINNWISWNYKRLWLWNFFGYLTRCWINR
ncbi:hypothetical protein ES288_A13G105700v1 [Gossypium darwinii]|uniref:Uncharacterized protein n=1 Tax=Gossypium darwinii TaxID=34276 RepID=A0A5D2DY88_GOSDA|nr:hypothetical protein ES288_A13G105700v1 [Gossypium darwinii]